MSLTLNSLQVLPTANDTSNFYFGLNPTTNGRVTASYASPYIYFNPQGMMLTVDSKISMQVTGQLMANNIIYSSIDATVIGANSPAPATFTTAVANTSLYTNKVGLYANTSTSTSAVYQVYNPATQTIDTIFG
jgi:hypothetical protein